MIRVGLSPEMRALLDRETPWRWGVPVDALEVVGSPSPQAQAAVRQTLDAAARRLLQGDRDPLVIATDPGATGDPSGDADTGNGVSQDLAALGLTE
jgi:hypothetical protein